MTPTSTQRRKAYKGLPMEGMIARWYAKSTARDIGAFEFEAAEIAGRLRPGADVLEVAPGPGYLAIALARRGEFRIVGLDVSRAFVRIAAENARRAEVAIDFRLGEPRPLPFPIRFLRLHRLPRGLQEFRRSGRRAPRDAPRAAAWRRGAGDRHAQGRVR